MSRLGRSYSEYWLHRPRVLGPANIFRPVETSLVAVGRPQTEIRRKAHSVLRPPAVVGPKVLASPIETKLVPSPRQARNTHSELRQPTVVNANVRFRPIVTSLAKWPTNRRFRVYTALRPPQIVTQPVAFVASPVKVGRVRQSQAYRRAVAYKLRLPTVVGPAVRFRTVLVSLARPARRTQHAVYQLRVPTVLGAVATVPPFAPIRVSFVRAPSRAFHVSSKLRPPATLVAATPRFRGVLVSLTRVSRKFQKSVYDLRPPTVTGAVVVPFIARPVKVQLARVPKNVRNTLVRIGGGVFAPRVVGPPPSGVVVHLVPRLPSATTRYVTSVLYGPQVESGTPQLSGSIKNLVQPPRQSRKQTSKLRPPVVITLPVVPRARPILVSLSSHPKQGRKPNFKLRPPIVLNPAVIFRPVKIKTVIRPKISTQVQYWLHAPSVAPTVNPWPFPPYDWVFDQQLDGSWTVWRMQEGSRVALHGNDLGDAINKIAAYEAEARSKGVPVSHQWGELYGSTSDQRAGLARPGVQIKGQ